MVNGAVYEIVLFYLLWVLFLNNEERKPATTMTMDAGNVSSDATER